MNDKVTRQCPQTTTFEEKGEPKQIRTEVPLLTSLINALPPGQTGSRPGAIPCVIFIVVHTPLPLVVSKLWQTRVLVHEMTTTCSIGTRWMRLNATEACDTRVEVKLLVLPERVRTLSGLGRRTCRRGCSEYDCASAATLPRPLQSKIPRSRSCSDNPCLSPNQSRHLPKVSASPLFD